MSVKDDRGKATARHSVCFLITCCHVSDGKVFILCVRFVPSLQSAFCTRSAVCILHWPIGVACDNTETIFSSGAISCFVYLSTILDSEAQPVETKVYNCNTYLHFPKLFPFLFLCPPCWILRRVTAVHSYPDSRLPAPGSRLPAPRSPFPVPRSLFPVLHCQF